MDTEASLLLRLLLLILLLLLLLLLLHRSLEANVETLKADFDDLVMKEKPKVGWKEVIGLEDAKRAIRESIVYPTKRADLFPLGWPRGILLYGPPGCGKTLLAALQPQRLTATSSMSTLHQ